MNITAHAKPGYCFDITEAGKAIGRINSKFGNGSKVYLHSVPEAWIKKGWVVEKEENNEQAGCVGKRNK